MEIDFQRRKLIAALLATATVVSALAADGTVGRHALVGEDGRVYRERLDEWSRDLRDADPEVRSAAALGWLRGMPWIDERDVAYAPALIAALDDPDPIVHLAAANVLIGIDPSHPGPLPVLRKAMGHEQARFRSMAVSRIRFMGPAARPAVPELKRLLDDPDDTIRLYAALALARIDPAVNETLPVLEAFLTDDHDGVRAAAVGGLEDVGMENPRAIPGLIRALGDADSNVWLHAVMTLGGLGRQAADAVPALVVLLDKSLPYAQALVRQALERIGTSDALKALEKQ